MIRKINHEYKVLSESGRNMGSYKTEEGARRRLRQIEFFRHKKK